MTSDVCVRLWVAMDVRWRRELDGSDNVMLFGDFRGSTTRRYIRHPRTWHHLEGVLLTLLRRDTRSGGSNIRTRLFLCPKN